MKQEVWKDIEGFPNYQVSNKGRVRNKETKYIITQLKSANGYMTVRIRRRAGDLDKPALSVHRLVAIAFIPNPENKEQVNHIDGNKINNHVDNLEWCTRKENSQHAMRLGLFKPEAPDPPYKRKVRIVETGEVFDNLVSCAKAIDGQEQNVSGCLNGKHHTHKDLHFEEISDEEYEKQQKTKQKPFLYPHQKEAVKKMFNGCILNGSTGSGKSRAGLYYYFEKNGGSMDPFVPMKPHPPDLFIITTAKKRNDLEWQQELVPFLMSTDPEKNKLYGNKVVVDSWNNIKKYADVKGAFFLFDEDKVTGKGAWARAFLKIAKHNEWVILSATAGDNWCDYETVFVANGFFKNRTEMRDNHYNISNYGGFPQLTGYRNETRLFRLRERLLIDMDFERHTVQHHEDVYVRYDIQKYKEAMKTRWDPFKQEPIQQASGLCYVLRRIVNEDESRQVALLELLENHPKAIIFYNFDNELDILLNLGYAEGTKVAQYNGHKHEPIPDGDKWVYLVNYNACEAWNTTRTDCMIFFSQNYSYKVMVQAAGRIDRLTTPYTDLYYYHLKSRSGIDLAISKALASKKNFNEKRFTKWE